MSSTTTTEKMLVDFVIESNRIEGIEGATGDEVEAFKHFVGLDQLYMGDVVNLVCRFQPDATLRMGAGQEVWIGSHQAPTGGVGITISLNEILILVGAWERGAGLASPYKTHKAYEDLHPFTDGNGRSGRAIWAWQMLHAPPGTRESRVGLALGFLHEYYYQSLQNQRGAT